MGRLVQGLLKAQSEALVFMDSNRITTIRVSLRIMKASPFYTMIEPFLKGTGTVLDFSHEIHAE